MQSVEVASKTIFLGKGDCTHRSCHLNSLNGVCMPWNRGCFRPSWVICPSINPRLAACPRSMVAPAASASRWYPRLKPRHGLFKFIHARTKRFSSSKKKHRLFAASLHAPPRRISASKSAKSAALSLHICTTRSERPSCLATLRTTGPGFCQSVCCRIRILLFIRLSAQSPHLVIARGRELPRREEEDGAASWRREVKRNCSTAGNERNAEQHQFIIYTFL